MKTVVTGASGHLGVNLVRALISRGRQVLVISHTTNLGLEGLPVEYIHGDVCELNSLMTAFKDADVVYHLAAHISLLMDDWHKCEAINVNGTSNVIEACSRTGVRRLVHFSTIHALNMYPFNVPVDESRPLIESTKAPPYDRSKAQGEKAILQAVSKGFNAIIIKPTGIIGPYDYRPSHFGQALLLMASGKLPILLDGGFDWVDIRDVAQYAIEAEQNAPAGSNYLFSGHWLSVRELAKTVSDLSGVKCPGLVCPMGLAKAFAPIATITSQLSGSRPIFTTASLNALISNRSISHAKATREIGYNPRPLHDTLADTIKWFQDNSFLKKENSIT